MSNPQTATSPPPPGPETPGPPREGSAQAMRRRHLVVIGGGRGGVGKSLLSVNIAVYLAQLGRNVVLCDADPVGANLHVMLGVHRAPLVPADQMMDAEPPLAPTSVPGLVMLPTGYDRWAVAPKRPSRHSHWMRHLATIDADYVVMNLGAAVAPASLDLFCEADIPICVASPEPPAVEATYRFCRALFARRLRRSLMRERFKLRVVERALGSLPPLPAPRALVTEIARFDEGIANAAATLLRALRPRLVVGRTRLRRDLELGPAMALLSERYLGVALDYLGYVEQDDAVWLTARRCRPLLIDAPTSKAARNIERVARRMLALLAQPHKLVAQHAEPAEARRLSAPLTLYQVLGVARTASDDEIRRAFKMQREIFKEGSLPLAGLVDEVLMRQEQARITEAYDTLLDPARRRAYELSVFPDDEPTRLAERERRPSATEAELELVQAELAREIGHDTEFTGTLLRRAREALGIEVQDIAAITKISPMCLRAIEAEDVDALPAPVYVRGFLQQVARALRLDPTQVTKTYLKRLRSLRPGYE